MADGPGDAGAGAEEEDVEYGEGTEFQFDIPECPTDTIMKVTAPDGIQLHISKQAGWQAYDKLSVVKGADGKWGIKCLIRVDASAQVAHDTGAIAKRSADQVEADLQDVNVSKVRLDTSKGPIDIVLQPSWAPQGSLRFLQLITDGFFNDIAVYRGVPKFLVQFGVVKDPKHVYTPIPDDPLTGIPILEGMVCFAASGANSRTSTICIFLSDIPQLGSNAWETPIGRVHPDSLATLKSLYTGYGDIPQCGGKGPDPVELAAKGNEYIRQDFPECDFIKSASWAQ
eukprot:TRINITY_DN19836_c1_g1_i2.p1 TRINITY_DN19836_c1_g1~~TRINITY_DN19836_c1_g1_i2.p1  ORF type:complete len:305 (-),score=62.45 TRINITY_DN19836_c1_g1_i2:115-966(-)